MAALAVSSERIQTLDLACTAQKRGKSPRRVEALDLVDGGKPSKRRTLGDCTICLGEIDLSGVRLKRLSCAHLFHKACVEPWLNENASCPNCRAAIQHRVVLPETAPGFARLILNRLFEVHRRLEAGLQEMDRGLAVAMNLRNYPD